jgi:hypothetical protein
MGGYCGNYIGLCPQAERLAEFAIANNYLIHHIDDRRIVAVLHRWQVTSGHFSRLLRLFRNYP